MSEPTEHPEPPPGTDWIYKIFTGDIVPRTAVWWHDTVYKNKGVITENHFWTDDIKDSPTFGKTIGVKAGRYTRREADELLRFQLLGVGIPGWLAHASYVANRLFGYKDWIDD